jgi:hypothetical protein
MLNSYFDETQMIDKSLEALKEYRLTGNGIPHEQVREWANKAINEHTAQSAY